MCARGETYRRSRNANPARMLATTLLTYRHADSSPDRNDISRKFLTRESTQLIWKLKTVNQRHELDFPYKAADAPFERDARS